MSGVGRCGSKNEHQKDTCLEYIGLCVQNWMVVLGPLSNILIGEKQDHEEYITILTQDSSWQSQLGPMH